MLIEISHGDQRLRLSTRGAMILGWDPGLGSSVLDGYRSAAEQEELDGFRNAVLVPWPNRTEDALWDDDGVARSTLGVTNEEGLHGLVWDLEFTPVGLELGDGGGAQADHVELVAAIPDSSAFRGPIEVRIRYDISIPGELGVRVSARNGAGRPAPIGLGWHPYFTVASLAEARVWLPATERIVVDGRLLPLEGEAAFVAIDEGTGARAATVAGAGRTGAPAPAWVPVGDFLREINLHDALDSAFTGLDFDGGVATAYVDTGLGYGLSIAMGRSRSLPAGGAGSPSGSAQADRAAKPAPCRANFHIFTGASLKRDPMKSIAIEPCSTMANMLNRPEEKARMMVPVGGECELNVRVALMR